jgi:hypothetical protein
MYTIDVTITATQRSTIFKKTVDSFFENMFDDYRDAGHGLNLILNIDPVGNGGSDFTPVLYGRFNEMLFNAPMDASFPKAFKYVWSNVHSDADFVFHLEDDWELLRNVNLMNLINILEKEDGLALLRLPAFYAMGTTMKNWNKWFPYNGDYYECPKELKTGLGFCGHPSLIRAEFVRNTAELLDIDRNPEKQFHSRGNTPIMQEVLKWRYGVYGIPGSPPLVRDIGREWMVKNNFRKSGSKAHFINWEKL